MRGRDGSLLVLAIGLVTSVVGQVALPVGLPLFDGVIVSDPYRFLSPPPGAEGSPTSALATIPVAGGASPSFAVFTAETPPQAELLAHGGELAIGVDSTAVTIRIDPIATPSNATGGSVVGNVYRIAVTDQAGAALALVPGQAITLAMRGPAGTSADATIARLVGGAWQPLQTDPAGLQDLFLANATDFGDFAILGTAPPPSRGLDPSLVILALVGAGLIALLGLRYGSPAGGASTPTRSQRRSRPS